MKKIIIIFILLVSKISFSKDILDLFKLAQKNHEVFKEHQLNIEETDLEILRLWKSILPTLNFESVHFYGDKTLIKKEGYHRIDTQQSLSVKFTLTQGWLRGIYKQLEKNLPKLIKSTNKQGTIQHFFKINNHYFNLMKLVSQKEFLEEKKVGLKKRVLSLNQRFKIGQSKKTEYLLTLAQLKRLEVDLVLIEEKIFTLKNNLIKLIGQEINFQSLKINFSVANHIPHSLGKQLEKHPDMAVVDNKIKQQKIKVRLEKLNYWPQFDLKSNYYLNRRIFGRQDNWNVSVNLSWNIFDFNLTRTKVQKEEVNLKKLINYREKVRKKVKVLLKNLKHQFKVKKKLLLILKDSLSIAEVNYKTHLTEFNKGLVNNIDLMRALDELIEIQKRYSFVNHEIIELWYAMKIFVGEFPK